jgi:hypothetical protein
MLITVYNGNLYIDDVKVASVILDKPDKSGQLIITSFNNVRFEDLTLTEDEKRARALFEAAKYLPPPVVKLRDGIRTDVTLEAPRNVIVGSALSVGGDFKMGD